MTDPPALRAVDSGDPDEARADSERAKASAYATRAWDELMQAEFGGGSQRQRQVHRDVAAIAAKLAAVYADRDLARAHRELARAMEGLTGEHRARREGER